MPKIPRESPEEYAKRVLSRTDDKKTWPDGPWQREPDGVEWVDKATGLYCRIKRNTWVTGSLCGYAGVPATHPVYGASYHTDVEYGLIPAVEWWRRHVTHRIAYKIYDIEVHGGLTFSGEWDDDGLWYFGFDCGHAGDFSPRMDRIEHLGENNGLWTTQYRDIAYVTAEVEKLAKQLAAITK